jgi:hypothetical protein
MTSRRPTPASEVGVPSPREGWPSAEHQARRLGGLYANRHALGYTVARAASNVRSI